jgi:hypothetical protein
MPVGAKGEAHRVVRRIGAAKHKGRCPPHKECAQCGSQQGEQGSVGQDELNQTTAAGSD